MNDFNRRLMSYPPNQRNYVMYIRVPDSSEGWVALLALKYLVTDSLLEITNDIDHLTKKPDIILICDDAAYSGIQIFSAVAEARTSANVFVAIPFLSQMAKTRIRSAKIGGVAQHRVQICDHQIMPTFGEINFTKTRNNREKFKLYHKFHDLCGTIFNHKIALPLSVPTRNIARGWPLYSDPEHRPKVVFVDHVNHEPPYREFPCYLMQSKL